jgi:hypothetical protein
MFLKFHRVKSRMLAMYNAFQEKTTSMATETKANGREIQLTRLALAGFAEQPVLPLIEQFWLDNFRRRTCFFDLQRMIVLLPTKELREFHSFISGNARSRIPLSPCVVSCPGVVVAILLTLLTENHNSMDTGRSQCIAV